MYSPSAGRGRCRRRRPTPASRRQARRSRPAPPEFGTPLFGPLLEQSAAAVLAKAVERTGRRHVELPAERLGGKEPGIVRTEDARRHRRFHPDVSRMREVQFGTAQHKAALGVVEEVGCRVRSHHRQLCPARYSRASCHVRPCPPLYRKFTRPTSPSPGNHRLGAWKRRGHGRCYNPRQLQNNPRQLQNLPRHRRFHRNRPTCFAKIGAILVGRHRRCRRFNEVLQLPHNYSSEDLPAGGRSKSFIAS